VPEEVEVKLFDPELEVAELEAPIWLKAFSRACIKGLTPVWADDPFVTGDVLGDKLIWLALLA
jgi:hypothetical protein